MAPEKFRGQPQTPKMDVWSLFATMAFVVNAADFRNKNEDDPESVFEAVKQAAAADQSPMRLLCKMAEVDHTKRASAGQMLAELDL